MTEVVAILGAIVGAGTFFWSIATYFYDKREKAQAEEFRRVLSSVGDSELRQAKEYQELKEELKLIREKVQDMAETLAGYKSEVLAIKQIFEEAMKRVERTLDGQDKKIADFGRVIMMGSRKS